FGHAGLADERLRQPLLVMHVIETVAPLHAQPFVVRRAVAPVDIEDLVVLDGIRELATDAAVGANGVNLLLGLDETHAPRRHQRAGRACLDAFSARDARRLAHRVPLVEHDARVLAAEGIADDVIDLLLAAGAHAARALDA